MKGVVAEPGAEASGIQVPCRHVQGIARSAERDLRPRESQQHQLWLRVGFGHSELSLHPYALHLGSSYAHDPVKLRTDFRLLFRHVAAHGLAQHIRDWCS